MKGIIARSLCMGLLYAIAAPAWPQDPYSGGGNEQQFVLNSEHFMSHHPDLKWRREGVWALEQGDAAQAAEHFRRAAHYADKPSQAMLAELYWQGRGVPRDRVLAYAWMDLAAERAYPVFLAKREHYWGALEEDERARVREVGLPLYDEYGDDVAKERLETLLRRARRNMTGSRVGYRGNLDVIIPLAGDIKIRIKGDLFHADEFWNPERYWEWQDLAWKEPNTGRVDILPIERVQDESREQAGDPRAARPDDDAP